MRPFLALVCLVAGFLIVGDADLPLWSIWWTFWLCVTALMLLMGEWLAGRLTIALTLCAALILTGITIPTLHMLSAITLMAISTGITLGYSLTLIGKTL